MTVRLSDDEWKTVQYLYREHGFSAKRIDTNPGEYHVYDDQGLEIVKVFTGLQSTLDYVSGNSTPAQKRVSLEEHIDERCQKLKRQKDSEKARREVRV